MKVRAETHRRQKHVIRCWRRGHGGELLAGLLLMVCLAWFLITSPGMEPYLLSCFFINHQSGKYSTFLPIGLSGGGSLSVENVSFFITLILGQIDIEAASGAADAEILLLFFLLLNDKHVCWRSLLTSSNGLSKFNVRLLYLNSHDTKGSKEIQ